MIRAGDSFSSWCRQQRLDLLVRQRDLLDDALRSWLVEVLPKKSNVEPDRMQRPAQRVPQPAVILRDLPESGGKCSP